MIVRYLGKQTQGNAKVQRRIATTKEPKFRGLFTTATGLAVHFVAGRKESSPHNKRRRTYIRPHDVKLSVNSDPYNSV